MGIVCCIKYVCTSIEAGQKVLTYHQASLDSRLVQIDRSPFVIDMPPQKRSLQALARIDVQERGEYKKDVRSKGVKERDVSFRKKGELIRIPECNIHLNEPI